MSGASSPVGVISVDGSLSPASEARVAALDRGFLYGDSAFEVTRTYGGKPYRLDAHRERLAASCARLRLPVPEPARIEADVARALAASSLDECYLRIIVTRGGGPIGIDPGLAVGGSLLVYALPLRLPPPEVYERGIGVALVQGGKEPGMGSAKSGNYLFAVMAVAEAHARGADDAVLCGTGGEILEGATSNLFVVRGGVLATPPLGVGVLSGITRRTVISLARALGHRVDETILFPPALYRAAEIFVTSSIREVVPVVRVDDVTIGDGRPGPVTRALEAAYREHTRGRAEPSG